MGANIDVRRGGNPVLELVSAVKESRIDVGDARLGCTGCTPKKGIGCDTAG